MRVLVTGAAGFIGFHLCRRLLKDRVEVRGLDNFSPYYSIGLKEARAAELARENGSFCVERLDLQDAAATAAFLHDARADVVVHLAAQPGVRYSIENPKACVEANITGFANLLEACRQTPPKHLVFASSSSVYGNSCKTPFSVSDPVDHPISLYAATKKANELMAHVYSHLYGIPTTGLRFFTVYGPWGRPDMAAWKFTEATLLHKPIDVYNFGNLKRDFTYIDDVIEGLVRALERIPKQVEDRHGGKSAPYTLYNIGNSRPTDLMFFISVIESAIGRQAEKRLLPHQPGDVLETYADITDLQRDVGFAPSTPIEEGLPRFVSWFREYHNL